MRTFTCDGCKETFKIPDGWTDDIAMAIQFEEFPEAELDPQHRLCEVCYRKHLPRRHMN